VNNEFAEEEVFGQRRHFLCPGFVLLTYPHTALHLPLSLFFPMFAEA
jgi:hypothetical protein